METKVKSKVQWSLVIALGLPLLLLGLFYLLRSNQQIMNRWTFGVVGPLEQWLGRLWSVVPFSAMEWMIAAFVAWNVIWLIRAVVLVMAHQRMVTSELEANFIGIAACVTCDDSTFQYSGYLLGLIQLCNALYAVDDQAWQAIVQQCFTPELAADWNENNAYWAALESPVEEVAGQAYDSYLKSNGQELGMRSYGACVDLLVSYFGTDPGNGQV